MSANHDCFVCVYVCVRVHVQRFSARSVNTVVLLPYPPLTRSLLFCVLLTVREALTKAEQELTHREQIIRAHERQVVVLQCKQEAAEEECERLRSELSQVRNMA